MAESTPRDRRISSERIDAMGIKAVSRNGDDYRGNPIRIPRCHLHLHSGVDSRQLSLLLAAFLCMVYAAPVTRWGLSIQEMSMRWKPLEGRDLPKWMEYPMMAFFMPLIIGLFGPLLAILWLEQQKRKIIGPRAEWSHWFAWHPVRSGRGFGNAVWLEWVERRVWYGQVEHRTLEEAKARA